MVVDYFHWAFVIVFVGFTAVRAFYQRQASRTMGRAEYKEGHRRVMLRLLFGIPFMLTLLVYMFYPRILTWAEIDLPAWMQWVGVILGAASIPLIWWVQRSLGSNFSTRLHVRDEHTLVMEGPYRWVRHPMYSALYLNLIAVFLLTENWFIGGIFLAALTLIVATRLRLEEQVMLDKFGEQYRTYMQRTGRFLPRLGDGVRPAV